MRRIALPIALALVLVSVLAYLAQSKESETTPCLLSPDGKRDQTLEMSKKLLEEKERVM